MSRSSVQRETALEQAPQHGALADDLAFAAAHQPTFLLALLQAHQPAFLLALLSTFQPTFPSAFLPELVGVAHEHLP